MPRSACSAVIALRPPRLRPGDVIGLLAPASPPARHEIVERSVRYLENRGYRVKVAPHIEARHGFSAGTDDQRAEDLNTFFADRQVKALFAIRGGNGCCRLLKRLDYALVRRNPKILVGYSDLTFLQLALWRRTGLITFSGPMPGVEFWSNPDPFTEEAFWDLLTSRRTRRVLTAPPESAPLVFRNGAAEGRLLGGCFSLVTSVLGTPFQPDFRGALLFVEDVREELHRIHRMFSHLDNAGILKQLAGLLVGQFTQATPEPKEPHWSLPHILDETLAEFRGPVLTNVAYGHIPRKLTLPQGVMARLDATRQRLTLLESPVS
ncbi:MAG: LD-carboxypeptidase [Verrucomicrobiales bacterium]|nr:LD-carboxypeptidase [Verrucomicrobiales bacterium]